MQKLLGTLLLAGALAPGIARADEPAAPSRVAPASKAEGDPAPSSADTAKPADDEPDPNVMRYPPRGVRWGLILGGSTLTIGAYVASLSAGFGWPEVPGSDTLKIPIVGPWIALAKNDCSADLIEADGSCGATIYVRSVLEVLSGLVQVAGLPLIGEGIFMTTEAPGKVDPNADPSAAPKEASSKRLIETLRIAPIVTPTTGGIGIYGTF
ncbi:MAG: hypothetical protein U0414_06910 [Polyangiaceae bacterium]